MNFLPQPSYRSAPGLIAPKLAIVAGAVVCLVALVLLTPSRNTLFKRHMVDGDALSASLLLEQEEAGNSDQIAAALTERTILICQDEDWEESSVSMLTGFLRNNANFKAAAGAALKHLSGVPQRVRGELLGAIVERSLADGELAFAQEIQMQLLEHADRLTPGMVRQAVATYRYNSNPALALITIDRLADQDGNIPPDLRKDREKLALETSQPELAFALINQRVRASRDPELLRDLIPSAIKTGVAAGRRDELIPLYEKYLAAAQAASGTAFPLTTEYSFALAQRYEWSGKPEEAFDAYVKLAKKGNRPALDRCLALTPGLFRQDEVMNALVAGYDHYRSDEKLLLLTARYLGDAARREESIRYFREYLERQPGDAEAHYRLGAVLDEAGDFQGGLDSFTRAHELDPENNAYLLKVVRLCTTLRLYSEAVSYLRVLSNRTRDRDHIEQYYTLSDGMGDRTSTKEALRLMIEAGGRLTAANYLYLAATHREEGDFPGTLKVLEEAHRKFPNNPFIGLELANSQSPRSRPDLALRALTGIDFQKYPRAAQSAVSALGSFSAMADQAPAFKFLERHGQSLEQCRDLSGEELLTLGEFCQRAGNRERARRLFRRIVAEGKAPGILAHAHYQLGQYRSASTCQTAHIKSLAKPASADYQMLGDIYSKLGAKTEARRAYEKALTLLKRSTAHHPRP